LHEHILTALCWKHGHCYIVYTVASMTNYAEMGFTTFDMADIYGPAEDIYGSFFKMVSISYFLHNSKCCQCYFYKNITLP